MASIEFIMKYKKGHSINEVNCFEKLPKSLFQNLLVNKTNNLKITKICFEVMENGVKSNRMLQA